MSRTTTGSPLSRLRPTILSGPGPNGAGSQPPEPRMANCARPGSSSSTSTRSTPSTRASASAAIWNSVATGSPPGAGRPRPARALPELGDRGLLVGSHALQLGPAALGDVAHDRQREWALEVLERAEQELDRQPGAVGPQGLE